MHENEQIFITRVKDNVEMATYSWVLSIHSAQTLICGESTVKLCFFCFFQPIVALCRKHVLSHDPAC